MNVKKLKETREVKKLSQEQLGEHCGVSRSAICQFENGTKEPSIALLKQIAKVLEIPVADLL